MPRNYLSLASRLLLCAPLTGVGQTLYDFGNPTGDEQLYIELINRARANPAVEGARLATTTDADVLSAYNQYKVNLGMMQDEFDDIPSTPPLAPNAALTNSGRNHSAWMLENNIQSHGSGATGLASRLTAAGYPYATASENVYAFSKSVWHGHAGFQVDWGTGGTGGMQAGRGHRTNIHNNSYREIGVGITYGSKTAGENPVGPSQVTQEFGRQTSNPIFGTGVAYYDLDGDNFYDPGEGIYGLTVNVEGVSNYCLTAAGGGWVVPVPANPATRAVTFSGLNINQTNDLVFAGATNAKLDLKLTYSPPFISTSTNAYTGSEKTVTFTPVGGATSYNWHRWTLNTAAAENCESIANITYQHSVSPLATNLKYQGSASFHLINTDPPGNRWVQLNRIYSAGASPSMNFRSRVRWATNAEKFKVQLKEEGTNNWVDVYSQTGSNSSGENNFALRTPSLAAFANKKFRIRFLLEFTAGGNYYPPDEETGWYFDAIQFSGMQQLENEVVTSLAGTTGSYTPSTTGTILQAINPVISGTEFPGTFQTLTVAAGPPPGFATWSANLESANSLPPGTLSDANGDHDKDGRANLLEYAFNTSPVTSSETTPRWPKVTSAPNSPLLTVDYQIDTSMPNLTCVPEAGASLSGWFTPGEPGAPIGFTDQLISTNGNIQTRRATLPVAAENKGFIRMRVTQSE
jgi:uncharacterized protein YkwD